MRLPKEDVDLFFKLMWRLQFYVNQQLQLQPDIQTVEEYIALRSNDKIRVRDALWENPQLIEAYVDADPDHLSGAERDVVSGWRNFVAGTFHVYRFLKAHTVFIGKGQVYGVLGLYDSLEDVFPDQPLPIMVEAVLLPFKGRITYDGLIQIYRVYFGSGMRSELHEEYMTAKQNGRIVTELGAVGVKKPDVKGADESRSNWVEQIDEVLVASERLRGGTVVQMAAFTLLRASAKVTEVAMKRSGDMEALRRSAQQVQGALRRLQTVLDRMER